MLVQTLLNRKFILKKGGNDIELKDADPTWSVDKIMSFHAHVHPELVNATYQEKGVEGEQIVYEFTSTVGVKG